MAKQAFHAKGAGFVGHDGHDVAADDGIAGQAGQHAHEGHGGGVLALATALQEEVEGLQGRHRQGRGLRPARGQVAAQGTALLAQVPDLGAVIRRPVEGCLADLLVTDGNVEAIAESAQGLLAHLLLLVGDVLALARLAHAVALDRLGQHHRGLALGRYRRGVGGEDLVRVMPAAVETPDVVVGQARHHGAQLGILAEELLAGVGAALGLESLVFTVDAFQKALAQKTLAIELQERIPVRAPHHLDHVPARAAKQSLQLLDDIAVAPHRSVQTLQVAVDHEDQVVEPLACGQGDGAERLCLVHLPVAEESPHLAVLRILQAPVVQVLHQAGLVDGEHG